MQCISGLGARLISVSLLLLAVGCGGGSGSNGNNGGGAASSINLVSVACAPSSIPANQTSLCSASVMGTGAFNPSVNWTAISGSIDGNGNYTAPGTATTATITATSVEDGSKSGTAKITVNSAITVASFSIKPDVPVSGNASTGTITSTSPAPIGGAAVMLSSRGNGVIVPSTVTLSAGSTTANFMIKTTSVTTATMVTVTATSANKISASLTVNPAATVTWTIDTKAIGGASNDCFIGDFNGDGKADLACHLGGGEWYVALSTGSGFQTAVWSGGPDVASPITNQCLSGDFNADGKTDLACYTGGSGSWNVALSTGSGWQSEFWNGGPAPSLPVFGGCFTGDFDGDGTTDLACDLAGGNWNLALSTGTGWQSGIWSGGPNFPLPLGFGFCFARDFNGDGKTDLACYQENAQNNWDVAISTGNGWQLSEWPESLGAYHTLPVLQVCLADDFNGDGKADLACFDSGYDAVVSLSSGTGWVSSFWSGTPEILEFPVTNYCFTGDLNGDRTADLACYAGGNAIWNVGLSTGASFQPSVWKAGPAPPVPVFGQGFVPSQCFSGDFNGDGMTDVACYAGGVGWTVALSSGLGW